MKTETNKIYCNWAASSPVKLFDYNILKTDNSLLRTGMYPDDCSDSLRDEIGLFFKANNKNRIIIGSGVTDLLNKLLLGISFSKGDNIITTVLEHNSVLRPLNYIKRVNELEITVLNPDDKGCINPEDLKSKIKKNTRLIIITHCSNVTGTIQPIKEIAKIARDHGVYMIVDCAQSTGRISINVTDINTDAIVFSSHKGLMGPSGIGFAILGNDFNPQPVFSGGTGFRSELDFQPEEMPYRLEPGTINYEGALLLKDSLLKHKTSAIFNNYLEIRPLMKYLKDEIEKICDFRIFSDNNFNSIPIINISHERITSEELGFILYKVFGVIARHGLHCSPLTHKWLGTYPSGTLRLSFGPECDSNDIERIIDALGFITRHA